MTIACVQFFCFAWDFSDFLLNDIEENNPKKTIIDYYQKLDDPKKEEFINILLNRNNEISIHLHHFGRQLEFQCPSMAYAVLFDLHPDLLGKLFTDNTQQNFHWIIGGIFKEKYPQESKVFVLESRLLISLFNKMHENPDIDYPKIFDMHGDNYRSFFPLFINENNEIEMGLIKPYEPIARAIIDDVITHNRTSKDEKPALEKYKESLT
jgi:hypothetical protein